MKKPIPFGKYYLLERINVGGMAEVFRAKAYGVEGFERLVAVKRILPNIAEDKEFISMFIDEAKIAVQLNHANIAQIFDLGMVDSSYYIALEHIHGRDMRAIFDRCRNRGQPMPVAQACFVVMKVCEGLDYAHNKRDASGNELSLVHRDVSPQNILVSFEGEVKLIDFGIAKAAGKGSKTQAGILKGKFGYMSPEQVRGLPIDRRSDIFSCGIVLYELLTGERLFVGESDFSTLEKVRNVEILPPSTYNRKIPDELERIVLKALAKDVEDRYQNAIDLHDELQAFVYTAGEFYSRKDLAGWMKKTFAGEIEEESKKLEGYRRLRPPEAARPMQRPSSQRPQTRPPTMPASRSAGRSTASFGAPPPGAVPPPPPARGAAVGMAMAPAAADLEWDDDELETQIYDNVHHDPGDGAHAPRPMAAAGVGAEMVGSGEPDLSSLVQTARGWEAHGSPQAHLVGGPLGESAPPARSLEPSPPHKVAVGSNNARSPYGEPSPLAAHAAAPGELPRAGDSSAVVRLVNMAEPIFDPNEPSAFGGDHVIVPQKKSRGALYALFAILALALVGGGVLLAVTLGSKKDKTQTAEKAATNGPSNGSDRKAPTNVLTPDNPGPAASGIPDQVLANTGFDLFVEPASIAGKVTIKLDGKISNTRPPMQIRRLVPGNHKIEIDAPPGFFSKSEIVKVEAGKAGQVTIRLTAIAVTGKFTSTPEGAEVYLVSDGQKTKLGKTPVDHKLDPTKTYEVVFEKKGYVTQSRPIAFSGQQTERVTAELEKAEDSSRRRRVARNTSRPTRPEPAKKVTDKPDPPRKAIKKVDKPDPPAGKTEYATFGVGSKPIGCTIYLDGRNVGKTPKLGLRAPAGKHRVTLVCNEQGIRDSFVVRLKAGSNPPTVRNLMHKLK